MENINKKGVFEYIQSEIRLPKTHYLKTWPNFFYAILYKFKGFEVRKNDRDFGVGDNLILQEFDPLFEGGNVGHFTGREIAVVVTSILHGGKFGIEEGFCVMGIEVVSK